MKLYLMRHALAYPAEENAERPLNPAGIDQAKPPLTAEQLAL